MLRGTWTAQMRLLCLTMMPDGGAMTPALRTLGYTPYSLRSSFQQGHASTHPIEWSLALDRKKTLNKALFAEYDCFAGPPAALLYDAILRDCPSYTKVVLVEEPDKARWAADYDAYLAKVQKAMRRTGRNKITVNFKNMLEKMVTRGAVGTARDRERPGAEGTGPASVSNYSYAKASAVACRTSSPSDLERALKVEVFAAAKERQKQAGTTEKGTEAEDEPMEEFGQEEEEEQVPLSSRALALERFEESVKMAVPSSRLLVYRYGDGWEPLCEFLDRPVPAEPFPPYDDGLHVLGFLQERIHWAETIMYVLVTLTAVIVLTNVWPYLGGVKRVVGELYQDYQLAFGADDGGGGAARAAARAHGESFEDTWRKRGGVVTVESSRTSS